MNNRPKVSIWCITYNHEQYIAQAIEGFLMQDFEDYEIVISDDHSTDGTIDILKSFKSKYPEKIRLILNDSNIGMMPNFIQALKNCRGEYIAMCEGDDFWSDKLKLKKQVEFLDRNKDYVLCFHDATVINDQDEKIWQFSAKYRLNAQQVYTFKDAVDRWFIPTCSIVFRNILTEYPAWFSTVKSGDIALTILLAQHGSLKYIDQDMGVYRKHAGGISATYQGYSKFESAFFLYRNFGTEFTGEKYRFLEAKQFQMFREYFDYAEGIDRHDLIRVIDLLKSIAPIRSTVLKFLYMVDINIFKKISWRIL